MANSKWEYVREFEQPDQVLYHCWPIVRIDGKNFHKFTKLHQMQKPNDKELLQLMNRAAVCVMQQFEDIIISYGQSDEYSFIFKKTTKSYNRRSSKLSSLVVSHFSSSFVFHWNDFFDSKPLQYPPTFDSRTICHPTDKHMLDYLRWRQADCHNNNLYNTCFWSIVDSGKTPKEAESILKGTLSKDKHEMLFQQFETNYNNLPQLFRKGTVIVRREKQVSNHFIFVVVICFH